MSATTTAIAVLVALTSGTVLLLAALHLRQAVRRLAAEVTALQATLDPTVEQLRTGVDVANRELAAIHEGLDNV